MLPAKPAMKAATKKAMILYLRTLMPCEAAEISSSRMAFSASPIRELVMKYTTSVAMTATMQTPVIVRLQIERDALGMTLMSSLPSLPPVMRPPLRKKTEMIMPMPSVPKEK